MSDAGDQRPIPDPTKLTTEAAEKLEARLRVVIATEAEHVGRLTDLRFEAVEQRFLERDRRYQERHDTHAAATVAAFTASDKAVHTALEGKELAVKAAFAASESAVAAAFESSEKAIVKAEISIEKRADATYVSLTELTRSLGDLMPRAEANVRIANTEERVVGLSSRLDRLEAAKVGVSEARTDNRAVIASVVGLVLAVLTVLTFIGFKSKPATTPSTPLSCAVAAPGQPCVTTNGSR